MVYNASGLPFDLDMTRLSGARVRAWWFSPRDGRAHDGDGQATERPFAELATQGKATFAPPTSGKNQDWVLVLDDVARGFGAPGSH